MTHSFPARLSSDLVTVYGAPGGRIAVGVTVAAQPQAIRQAPTRGRIWATAVPVNEPGSAEVRFADVRITGDTDGIGGDLLLRLGHGPGFPQFIPSALPQHPPPPEIRRAPCREKRCTDVN